MRISTRSSSSRLNSIAGAGLRIVVAPAARARLKKATMVGSGISNWLTAMSPLASAGAVTSAALTCAFAPGIDDNGVVGIGDGDDRRPGMGLSALPHQAEVDSLRGEKGLQRSAECIPGHPADQRHRRAELGGCDRLVCALAAGKIEHGVAGDGLADAGMPVGGCHHIHVDASGNEDAPHAIPGSSPHAPPANAILTTSMSVSVGKPASLPRRWILKVDAARANTKWSCQLLPGLLRYE